MADADTETAAITTTVTWDDLIEHYDDERATYREAYDDLVAHLDAEYDAAVDTPTSDDDVTAIQQQAARYEQAVEQTQKRQHVLGQLRDAVGEGDFEIKMLSGRETMRLEREVREAVDEDTPMGVVQTMRNQRTVDVAVVDAPAGVPHADGEPVPSEAPNALTLALWDHVEAFNSAGDVDFQPAGCGDDTTASSTASSPTPSIADASPAPSAPTDDA